jgi:hypothetical protein
MPSAGESFKARFRVESLLDNQLLLLQASNVLRMMRTELNNRLTET